MYARNRARARGSSPVTLSNLKERGMDNPFSIIASDLGRTVAQAKPLLMKLDNADTSTRPAKTNGPRRKSSATCSTRLPTIISALFAPALQGSLTFPGYEQNPLVDLQRFSDVTGISWSISGPLTIVFSLTSSTAFPTKPQRSPATSGIIHRPRWAGSLKITSPT